MSLGTAAVQRERGLTALNAGLHHVHAPRGARDHAGQGDGPCSSASPAWRRKRDSGLTDNAPGIQAKTGRRALL
jgi:hypothetical protein